MGHRGGGSLKALLKHQGEIPSSEESQLPLHCSPRTRMGITISSLGFSYLLSTTINPSTDLPGEILMLLGPCHTMTSPSLHSHDWHRTMAREGQLEASMLSSRRQPEHSFLTTTAEGWLAGTRYWPGPPGLYSGAWQGSQELQLKPLSIICPQNSRGWAWRLS